ncbi:MAG: hypothetical protein AAF298_29320 [Cyanobacteria bacterium P01_A01_bin.40]
MREKIADRSVLVESYTDVNKAQLIDIVEGNFTASNFGGRVFLPPFEKPPKITLQRLTPEDSRKDELPLIKNITTDAFDFEFSSTSYRGEYKFRARGTLLRRIEEKL